MSLTFAFELSTVVQRRGKKMNQIARVNWNHGQYSDVFRSAIVDTSPLKEGQKVRVIWGKGKKEYSATIRCYHVVEEPAQENTESDLQPHQAKAKRQLVSNLLICLTLIGS